MMVNIILALLAFPASYLFFLLSERMFVRHESRVGKDISFGGFLFQSIADTKVDFKLRSGLMAWVFFAFQCSLVFLLYLNVEYVIFIYLALTGCLLIFVKYAASTNLIVKRIHLDRNEVNYAVAVVMVILCLFAGFTLSGSASLTEIHFHPFSIFFVVPFQVAGMILFREHPFEDVTSRISWFDSIRFYFWSMFCVKMFLGGGEFFFDLHLKAGLLYLFFRIVGKYFPVYDQRDLIRMSVLYFFPITGLVWFVTVILHGILEMGAAHV